MQTQLATFVVSASLLVACAQAQQPSTSSNAKPQDCRAFVQQFYDWYVPLSVHGKGRTWETAVHRKAAAFSPDLVQAIDNDGEAQAKTPDDIVGLDFDPFLSSQDPGGHYSVKQVKEQGTVCFATVSSGRKNEDITADLESVNGAWRFVNFHYATEQMDLMQLLKQMEADGKADAAQKK